MTDIPSNDDPAPPPGPSDPTAAGFGSPFPGTPPAAPPPGSYPPLGGPAASVPPGPGYQPPGAPPVAGGYGAPAGYGYGPPGGAYGGYPIARDHPQGTTILILGICSWVLCGLCAPFAWVMGNNALREIDRNPAAYSNRGSVQAGRILGMIYSILMIIGIVAVVAIMIVAVVGSSSSA